ncbi:MULTISPECIES: hypothetical protein [unclassified Acinetobacter]|uniref:hypothetical protein n=1 Tax=unclassified Acinetobacter TaxID=196816 RepID=UPI00124BDE59|nr:MULTISPECIES: hypothetical protein [unclassified Acinetobacter]
MEKIKFYTHQNPELKTEALKILFALGYVWKGEHHYLEQRLPDAIYGNEGGLILLEHQLSLVAFNELYKDSRAVNIKDLRAMLVLHLNDVNNATHEALDGSCEYLQLNDKFYVFESEKWIESTETDVWHANNLRPIPSASTPSISLVDPVGLKEFLDPQNSYQYFKTKDVGINPTWISIPEGAHLYFMEWFYKRENDIWYAWMGNSVWTETEYQFNTSYANVHWVREGFELPNPPVKADKTFELNNFKYVDGVEAVTAVRAGLNVEYGVNNEKWEIFNVDTGFRVGCLIGQPNRNSEVVQFRIVPKTLKIVGVDGNVYEFPNPICHYPPEGTTCFIATLSDPGARLPQQTIFSGNEITKMWVDHRRLHLTAEAALAHIEAEVRALGGNF